MKLHEKRGVTEEMLNPKRAVLDWKEMEVAVKRLLPYILDEDSKLTFGILYDPDADGFFSGYCLEDFLKQCGIPAKHHMNHNKVHGLQEEAMEWVEKENIDILFIVDAGSGDEATLNLLAEQGKIVFVLDHHPYETTYLDSRVTRVNVSDYPDYPKISGCGVTYRFIELLEKTCQFGIVTDKYEKFVGITILSDICDMTDAENRYYVKQAYDNYNSENFFRQFPFYGSYQSLYSYKLIPYINGLIRCNRIEDVLDLAANLDNFRVIRKVKDDIENVRKEQQERQEIVKSTSKKYVKKGVTVLFRNPDDNASFNGLVANSLLSEYKRGALVMIYHKDTKMFKGSFRGYDFTNELLTEWGFECHGHDKACGVSISKEGLTKFLKEFDHTPVESKDYDFKVKSDTLTTKDWTEIAWFNEYAGMNLPKIAVLIDERPAHKAPYTRKTVWIYNNNLNITDFGVSNEDFIVEPVINSNGYQLIRR